MQSKPDGDPTGVAGFGWAAQLLPYLQQEALYNFLGLSPGAVARRAARQLMVRELATDRAADVSLPVGHERAAQHRSAIHRSRSTADLAAAKSNYIANHGTQFVTLKDKQTRLPQGFVRRVLARQQVHRGAHHRRHEQHDPGRRTQHGILGRQCGSARATTTATATPACGKCSAFPTPRSTTARSKTAAAASAASTPGGAFFVFADGHVEFINEDIEFEQAGATSKLKAEKGQMGLYQRLLRRNDGQVLVRQQP